MTTSGHSQPSAPPAHGMAAVPPRGLDLLCLGLVLLMAGFLASFPARNSDLWAHLAAGRALAQGDDRSGPGPFVSTTEEPWLYDLLAYCLYESLGEPLGGAALVAVKALLIVALCGVLLRLSARRDWRWAALGTALAVLALGPYLALRPACVSYLFLGLTLGWLEKTVHSPAPPPTVRASLRACLPLLGLFVLWVNLDEWFLLGPLAVGLYLVGAALGGRGQPRPGVRTLAAAFVAGLAVCLVNPYHVRAFALPEALLPDGPAAGVEIAADLPISPFQRAYFADGPGRSPAGLAYYPLVLLGLLSFAAGPRGERGPRAVLWLALFGLSAYRAATVPFFAVVAGPLAALNFQEGAPPRAVTRRSERLRAAVGPLLIALAVAAWPGWLQPGLSQPRRWAVEPDPSLRQAAEALARWHQDGLLTPQARGFNLSPAAANYFAWACPAERGFLDRRPRAFSPEARGFHRTVRGGLLGLRAGRGTDWRKPLGDAGVTHLIVYDPREDRLRGALRTLFAVPQAWELVAVEGGVAVFARLGAGDAVRLPRLDLATRTFHPPEGAQAPPTRPVHDPEPRAWWHAFWKPRPPVAAGRGEALILLTYFEAAAPSSRHMRDRFRAGELAAGAVGISAPGSGLPGEWIGLTLRASLLGVTLQPPPRQPSRLDQEARRLFLAYRLQGDDGPPGVLLGAVRAARRALHDDPDDPLTHLRLGKAYLGLMLETHERVAFPLSPLLDQLRTVQALTALKTAVRLQPNLSPAHADLADVYGRLGYRDLELEHLEKLRELMRAAGPNPGESPEQFESRLRPLEEGAEHLGKDVRERQNRYESQAFNLEVYPRAQAAFQRGLAKKALEILTRAQYTDFGVEGAQLELELLLNTGQVERVREWMEPAFEGQLKRKTYRWLQIKLAAASGDYARADADLALLTVPQMLEAREFGRKAVPVRTAMELLVGRFLLVSATDARLAALGLPGMAHVGKRVGDLRERAELLALRGLLALERGAVGDARREFGAALGVWTADAGGALGLARHYLKLLAASGGREPPVGTPGGERGA